MQRGNGDVMKIKLMLSFVLLVSVVSSGVYAMGGARDFARKLFISKAGFFAGAVGTAATAGVVVSTETQFEDLFPLSRYSTLADQEIKDIFKKNYGLDIEIVVVEEHDNLVATTQCDGKQYLFVTRRAVGLFDARYKEGIHDEFRRDLSNGKIDVTNPQSIIDWSNNRSDVYPTKKEMLAVFEHEKEHLKHPDTQEKQFYTIIGLPSIILATKAARLLGRSRLASGAIGFTQATLFPILVAQRYQQREKRCDLSIATSEAALHFAFLLHKLEEERNKKYPGLRSQKVFSLIESHPPIPKRVEYLLAHAQNLKKQGK